MSYYNFGESFKWFMARVVDNKDPEFLGRVKIRVIHDQTGDLGSKKENYGISDDELLWAYPISSIQSASLSYKKIRELENYNVPDWIDAVGISPTGIAIGSYAFGFYLDGHESNIPLIFGTYHKISIFPEPGKNPTSMLQDKIPSQDLKYYDVSALAKGWFYDPLKAGEDGRQGAETGISGQTLPKAPYSYNRLWTNNKNNRAPVDEFPTAYGTEYPYNLTYTTKSGHAIELDDTIGHERIHIWHKSGSYEEISNGPSPLLEDSKSKEYPNDGPRGYEYKTASGKIELDYIGRRVRKTKDTFFDIVDKDHNQLIKRDHNVEIANTETIKIGGSTHTTIGWPQPPSKNRDNNKDLGKGNYFLDIANTSKTTVANNYVLSVGLTPLQESTLKSEGSYFLTVNNNKNVLVGNNSVTEVRGNMITAVQDNFNADIAKETVIKIGGATNIHASKGIKIVGGTTVYGSVYVDGALGTNTGASGAFSTPSGKVVTVMNGIVTSIA